MEIRSSQIFVPLTLLLLGIVTILLLTISSRDIYAPPPDMYGIVLDAGSSHTSMYIYKWPADKLNDTGVVSQHSEYHVKGGGISSYAGKPGAAALSLEDCLKNATMEIPKARHQLTPIYLGATAGMRLLNISDPKRCASVLKEVGEKIKSYPFNFKGAAIISGQKEGAYGWVTVNYLLENFIKYGFIGRWLRPGKPTVGALDFGGASTQITFVNQDHAENPEEQMALRLYGQNYTLYTHSFLCYGRDQMLLKLLAQILKSQSSGPTVSHPCYPEGLVVNVTLRSVFDSPCTTSLRPTPYDPEATVTLKGTGEYAFCRGNMSEIFDFQNCSFSKCSFDQVFQPNVSGNFMAFSAFFYVHAFLEHITGVAVNTPAKLEEATGALCKMSFNEMFRKAQKEGSRLQDYCAASVFINELLLKAYAFDEESFTKIDFQKKAGDTSVGWALGYMLILSNLVPAESLSLRKALLPNIWVFLIVLSTLLLVAALGLLVHHSYRQQKGARGDP
ncbi:ectonucleoside triphosphate diphosphohydrolase 2 [Clupea harengus]|uniref:Ectonucleoside triphosphate diphosphohydrolase 2 n=1 Tax=Clupea harengus TaxID=7950 RepID=A0A6P3W090_CLUHA|nr:ectonucleoside triphosphate diphosphohydrolase 2 [Clupea harengus]